MVNNVTFLNLQISKVKNPIIIDQMYCLNSCGSNDEMSKSRVQIKDVRYEGIRGTSNTQVAALSRAWSEACGNNGGGVVLIPALGRFLVLPLLLQGPCHGFIRIQFDGELLAPTDNHFATGNYWLSINQVNNLFIDGLGRLNGRGSTAWYYKSANRPISMKLNNINTARIRNIKSYNSKLFHFAMHGCHDVTFDHVTMIAPANSPNTDGIHISSSSGINIMHSMIGTGDDCISLGPGSKFINITNVRCGPGHGISIGSLGKYPNEEDIFEVTVRDSTFIGTSNGVRIKSWLSSYSSMVSKVTYMNLQMNNVKNPVPIDQMYCPDSCGPNAMSKSRVHIKDVRYEGIRGTSNTQVAVNFECSQVFPCEGIGLQDINLPFNGGGNSTSRCHNVRGSTFGQQLPPSCL
ncbi:exopolygalacturonase-like [Benincasa hispida]|uniref:exopolygalacturonase-like n=1 Tax=Benincasa hispida TaxID=102211 RepID=UPI0018FF2A32|nr:exopolygalacturonase-like [Benincasa hispida]